MSYFRTRPPLSGLTRRIVTFKGGKKYVQFVTMGDDDSDYYNSCLASCATGDQTCANNCAGFLTGGSGSISGSSTSSSTTTSSSSSGSSGSGSFGSGSGTSTPTATSTPTVTSTSSTTSSGSAPTAMTVAGMSLGTIALAGVALVGAYYLFGKPQPKATKAV